MAVFYRQQFFDSIMSASGTESQFQSQDRQTSFMSASQEEGVDYFQFAAQESNEAAYLRFSTEEHSYLALYEHHAPIISGSPPAGVPDRLFHATFNDNWERNDSTSASSLGFSLGHDADRSTSTNAIYSPESAISVSLFSW